jgi:hypothetical protein
MKPTTKRARPEVRVISMKRLLSTDDDSVA